MYCSHTVIFFQRDTTGQGQVGGQAAAGTGGGGGGFQQPQLHVGPRTIPVMDEQGEYSFKLYMLCVAYIVYYMP